MHEEKDIRCIKCGSSSLHSGKKGFSGVYAFIGCVLAGLLGFFLLGILGLILGFVIGLLMGFSESNTIKITCLKCGNKFEPGEQQYSSKKTNWLNIIIYAIIITFALYLLAEWLQKKQ